MQWPPLESKGEFKYHLISYATSVAALSAAGGPLLGASAHFGSGASLSGSVGSVTSLPFINQTSSAKMSMLGSPGGSVSGLNGVGGLGGGVNGGGSIFSSNSSVISNLNTVSGASMANPNTSSTAMSNSHAFNPVARALFATDRLCTMVYYPQNAVVNVVAMCSGPPLDILKRASEVGIKKMKNMNSGVNYRNSRYWLCLYRLKLLFFQYYGDIAPRLVADVSQANAVILLDSKGRKTPLVNVVHADLRVWLLEFDSKKEAGKFEFALHESRKACENGSIFAQKSEILSPDTQFEYKVAQMY